MNQSTWTEHGTLLVKVPKRLFPLHVQQKKAFGMIFFQITCSVHFSKGPWLLPVNTKSCQPKRFPAETTMYYYIYKSTNSQYLLYFGTVSSYLFLCSLIYIRFLLACLEQKSSVLMIVYLNGP